MRPLVCRSNPATARSKVVLPQPDGPSKATNSPSCTSSETPCNAACAPKNLVTDSMRISAIFRVRSSTGDAPQGEQVAAHEENEQHRRQDQQQTAGKLRLQRSL